MTDTHTSVVTLGDIEAAAMLAGKMVGHADEKAIFRLYLPTAIEQYAPSLGEGGLWSLALSFSAMIAKARGALDEVPSAFPEVM